MLEPGHDCWDTCRWIVGGLLLWATTLKIVIIHLYKAEKKADQRRIEDNQEALDKIRKRRR